MFHIKKRMKEKSEIYKTEIRSIGPLAKDFLQEKMLILFGSEAPDGLKDYCFGINVTPVTGSIQIGQYVYFDDHSYRVTAVGHLVQKNLVNLGHITIKFDGSTKADLAGTLYLEDKHVPDIQIGMRICIVHYKL